MTTEELLQAIGAALTLPALDAMGKEALALRKTGAFTCETWSAVIEAGKVRRAALEEGALLADIPFAASFSARCRALLVRFKRAPDGLAVAALYLEACGAPLFTEQEEVAIQHVHDERLEELRWQSATSAKGAP